MVNFVLVNAAEASQESRNEKLKKIFHKPLIVGASVSADYHAISPGKKVALQYTQPENIKVIAQNGKPSFQMLPRLTEAVLKSRSSLVGVDLFFWDSFRAVPDESLQAMTSVFNKAKTNDLDLILGEIPEVVPFYQKSALVLNQKMRELCSGYAKCKILPLHGILREALSKGFIVHKNKKYTLSELLPDGLHISSAASDLLADEMIKLF